MTRAELSRALGINQGTLANYENEIREADYKTLMKIATFFDISVDYLIGFDAISYETPPNSFKPLSAKEKRFFSIYRSLSAKSQEIIDDTLNHFWYLETKK